MAKMTSAKISASISAWKWHVGINGGGIIEMKYHQWRQASAQ
jgi:hypothetical protein